MLGADDLGQPPVDDERLAEIAEHHVVWLEIAMNNAAAVSKGHRFANALKSIKQLAQFVIGPRLCMEPGDHLLQTARYRVLCHNGLNQRL